MSFHVDFEFEFACFECFFTQFAGAKFHGHNGSTRKLKKGVDLSDWLKTFCGALGPIDDADSPILDRLQQLSHAIVVHPGVTLIQG